MTEQRFKHSEIIQDDGQTICYGIEDTQTRHIFNVIGDGIYDVSEKELIKLLNALHEEKEELIDALNQRTEQCDKLHEENEQLKQELKTKVIVNKQYEELQRLKKENEQLKQAYNDAKKDVEKKEQILNDIMEDNLLIQDIKKELQE